MTGLCSPFWTIQRRNAQAAILPVVYWNAPRALTPYSSTPLRRPSGRAERGGTGGEEREGEGRMKTASRGKVEWNGRTVGNRCNVHRFRVVLNGRNCRVRTKILLVSLPLPPLFRIIKETTTKMIFLLPSFGSQRNRTLANFWNVSSFVPFVESNPFFVRFSWNKFHLKKNLF